MAKSKDILGNVHITADEAVSISLERYDELVKKEAIYDEFMKDKELNIYPYTRIAVKEVKEEE